MTIHIISVGLSIFDGIERSIGADFDQSIAGFPVTDATHVRALLKQHRPQDWLSNPARDALDGLEPTHSAEWATFAAQATTGSLLLPDGDTAYLLASDTLQGLQAAVWTAHRLARDPSRISYCDEASRFAPHPVRGKVAIFRIPGLDAAVKRAFESSMETLGYLGAEILKLNRAPQEPVKVHLSGGYKASIPFLISLAEGLRAAPAGSALPLDVTALCLFEGTPPAGQSATPIAIPLRQLDSTELENVASAFEGTPSVANNPSSALTGYTHARDPQGRWCLTPFGRGLVQMHDAKLGVAVT